MSWNVLDNVPEEPTGILSKIVFDRVSINNELELVTDNGYVQTLPYAFVKSVDIWP